MKFETKTLGTVRMKFRHQHPSVTVKNQPSRLSSVKLDIVHGETMCLLNLETMEPSDYAIGKAYTHPDDSYDKETGRLISLTRAMEILGLSNSESRELLSAYYGR